MHQLPAAPRPHRLRVWGGHLSLGKISCIHGTLKMHFLIEGALHGVAAILLTRQLRGEGLKMFRQGVL